MFPSGPNCIFFGFFFGFSLFFFFGWFFLVVGLFFFLGFFGFFLLFLFFFFFFVFFSLFLFFSFFFFLFFFSFFFYYAPSLFLFRPGSFFVIGDGSQFFTGYVLVPSLCSVLFLAVYVPDFLFLPLGLSGANPFVLLTRLIEVQVGNAPGAFPFLTNIQVSLLRQIPSYGDGLPPCTHSAPGVFTH